MHCVANYEVGSAISIVSDELVLKIEHPKGTFKALIRNIPRTEYTVPFLLSIHLYFDAPSLDDAKEVAGPLIADCLNMLAFTTGSAFRTHRIRQIIDAEPGLKAERDVRMWGERIEYDDPQPFLKEVNTQSIERLLAFDIPPAVRRALRWYRLGIDADGPDDQFTYFWFAIEILAEFQKPTKRVHDKCSKCQSALYCEKCDDHPTHKPYAKQAIRQLMMESDKTCDEAIVTMLDETRNNLLHGSTLKEIESKLPEPHESVVNVLGKILWWALVHQFPREMFDGTLILDSPSTYLHYKLNTIGHMRTFVPQDSDGNFDLSFTGIKMEVKPFGPPQSSLPKEIQMTHDEYTRLRRLSYLNGSSQEMLGRICQRVKEHDEHVHALVLATDLITLRRAVDKKEPGEWQELFSDILARGTRDPEFD